MGGVVVEDGVEVVVILGVEEGGGWETVDDEGGGCETVDGVDCGGGMDDGYVTDDDVG